MLEFGSPTYESDSCVVVSLPQEFAGISGVCVLMLDFFGILKLFIDAHGDNFRPNGKYASRLKTLPLVIPVIALTVDLALDYMNERFPEHYPAQGYIKRSTQAWKNDKFS